MRNASRSKMTRSKRAHEHNKKTAVFNMERVALLQKGAAAVKMPHKRLTKGRHTVPADMYSWMHECMHERISSRAEDDSEQSACAQNDWVFNSPKLHFVLLGAASAAQLAALE
jgi:hypothetical protein